MKKATTKILVSLIFAMLFIIYCSNARTVEAAWESYDINGIDETKYPGYKSQIQAMQSQHPNWTFKVLYTGLNWNDVIAGEYVGHGGSPSSLIQNTYSGEWICPICGYKTYDVSQTWYCASKEAISYMMDPRNSLTEAWTFQFQDLSSSSGTKSEITTMVSGTFLNNEECINAIMQAAQESNISPFHLVSRIKQEQGSSGMGSMNGYLYNGVIVYNLFNINVSGNDSNGLLAGAEFAYNQGWFTKEASIRGGAKFLREKYLDKGQTTLYFQKYNVVDQSNLYKHQYMQNIRAANDEGNTIYNAYKNNGILDSHFEFTIPLYENMPYTPCSRPLNDGDKYCGDITSQITEFNVNKNSSGAEYISGNIIIVEWINGNSTVPRTLPKMTLESTDGSFSQELFVSQISGNTYYFDKYIDGLDKSKKYIIRAELTEGVNISTNKSMKVTLPDKTFINSTCYISNNILYLGNYEGGLTHQLYDISLNQTDTGRNYISGTLMAIEWINEVSTVPSEVPKMTLKSTDGTRTYEMFVKYNGNNDYYFDLFIDGIDTSKKYQLNLELVEENNVSKYKKNTVKLTDGKLGELNSKEIIIENNTICIQYEGNLTNELLGLNLNKTEDNKYYISGEVVAIEWINGKSTVPQETPKITLVSTDGTVETEAFVTATGTNTYYFDKFIDNIDTSKQYKIKIELVEKYNISTSKVNTIDMSKRQSELGRFNNYKLIIQENSIVFEDESYIGDINSELKTFNVGISNNSTYVSGEIVVVEWVDGKSTVPEVAPKMSFKSTDGTVNMEVFVTATGTNTYYFDRFIEGIDTSKEYYFEIESGDSRNISEYRSMNVYFTQTKYNDTIVGKYHDKNIRLLKQKILFEEDTYIGNINSELKQFNLGKSGTNSYVSGEIVVVEWVDGKSTVPEVAPKMSFKSTDGKVNMEVFVTATGTNTYYFDRFIEGIDTSKEYYFEIESGDSRNVSEYRSMNVYFNGNFANKVIGNYQDKTIILENNKIVFK